MNSFVAQLTGRDEYDAIPFSRTELCVCRPSLRYRALKNRVLATGKAVAKGPLPSALNVPGQLALSSTRRAGRLNRGCQP